MLAPSSTNDVQHFPKNISTSRRCKYCPSEGNSSSPFPPASSYTSSSFPTCSSPSSTLHHATDQEIKIIQGRTYSSKNLHRIYCAVTGTLPPATISRLHLILLFSYFLLILISVYLTYVCHSLFAAIVSIRVLHGFWLKEGPMPPLGFARGGGGGILKSRRGIPIFYK